MFDLLHMDVRRMSRAKAFWITLAVFCGIILLLCGMLTVTADENLVVKFAGLGGKITLNEETISDPGAAQEELLQKAAEAREELTSMTRAEFFYSLLCQGGGLTVFVAIFSTLFVCEDFSSGFAKNIFSVRNRGLSYLLAKGLTLICTTAVFIGVSVLLSYLCFVVFRMPLLPSSPADQAKYLLQAWVTASAFAIQNLFFCVWLRNVGLGIIFSFVCAGGVLSMALESFTRLFGLNLTPYLLFGTLMTDGVTLQGTLVCLAWSVLYLLLSTLILRKKDI